MCDKIIEETKTMPTKFNKEKQSVTICSNQYFLLLDKIEIKQKHLQPFHVKNNKLRDVLYY